MSLTSNAMYISLIGLFQLQLMYKEKTEPKKNIVVIGYGWGGKNFCDNINHRKYNVTVVSKTTGMLDTTKLKKVFKPLVLKQANLGSTFINRECVDVDTQLKQVKLTGDLILPYDMLVLAVGSVANDFGIKGITEHCHFLKTVEDHAKLQQALLDIKAEDKRSEDPIVIIGAGPTGIELAFELSKEGYKVSLIDAMPNILPMFSSNIAHIVTKQLEKYGIALHLNTKIDHIDKNHINHNIPYKLAVWTCGVKANPLIRQITSAPIVPVNDNLQVVNNQDIYAIGDITAHGPLTAQKAKQQGIYLAKKLNGMVKEDADADVAEEQEPFVYKEYIKILNTRDFMLVDAKDANLVFRIPRFYF